MSDLERRYRRVLRLLPGWYREQWEQDMAAAFLDSWLTGDPYTDECVLEFCKPGWAPAWPAWPSGCTWAALALRAGMPGDRPYGVRCSPWCWCTRCWPSTCWCS
jgi:hypothetical protein